jgi:hypothetical protein
MLRPGHAVALSDLHRFWIQEALLMTPPPIARESLQIAAGGGSQPCHSLIDARLRLRNPLRM